MFVVAQGGRFKCGLVLWGAGSHRLSPYGAAFAFVTGKKRGSQQSQTCWYKCAPAVFNIRGALKLRSCSWGSVWKQAAVETRQKNLWIESSIICTKAECLRTNRTNNNHSGTYHGCLIGLLCFVFIQHFTILLEIATVSLFRTVC